MFAGVVTSVLSIIAGIVTAIVAIGGPLVVWYIKTRPEAKEKKRKEQNVKIHNAVHCGDVDFVRKLLRKKRAES